MIKSSRGCCGAEELAEVKEAFEYGYFGLAYKTNEFEQKMAEYLETDRFVITTSTGTNALHLAMDTIGIKPGDEVLGVRVIGIPPIPIGFDKTKGTVFLPYTKPCHGTSVVELPINEEEVEKIKKLDTGNKK